MYHISTLLPNISTKISKKSVKIPILRPSILQFSLTNPFSGIAFAGSKSRFNKFVTRSACKSLKNKLSLKLKTNKKPKR